MENKEIQALIEDGIPGSQVRVTGDGSHFDITVICEAFEGMTMVQEQKMVYALLNEKITSGELHAVTIKAYTPAEWEKAQRLQIQ
jgi:acid stress-induced BolA-like protein IbaG/YrbA